MIAPSVNHTKLIPPRLNAHFLSRPRLQQRLAGISHYRLAVLQGGAGCGKSTTLLHQLGLPNLLYHPGYQLRIQLFGAFRLWRGGEEVPASAWKRKSARDLFLLLITHRGAMLERDQILEHLWPHLSPAKATRDFKSAYSHLCNLLEPQRRRNTPSAYIKRDGSNYGLRPTADLWLDAAEFERQIKQGDALWQHNAEAALPRFQQSLTLYRGKFLQEYPYVEWGSGERERLLTCYLRTAERVGRVLLAQGDWEGVIEISQAILSHDPCWEQAYRLLMQAYDKLGNRAQVVRAYQRCTAQLQTELEVAPSAMTIGVYEGIVGEG